MEYVMAAKRLARCRTGQLLLAAWTDMGEGQMEMSDRMGV